MGVEGVYSKDNSVALVFTDNSYNYFRSNHISISHSKMSKEEITMSGWSKLGPKEFVQW